MAQKITMQHIADQLNISKNSVSQALSGKPGVSTETRDLIIKTAEKMGYKYQPKRFTATSSSLKNIALIASEFAFSQKSFFGEIYLAIERELSKNGMNLFIQAIDQHSKEHLILPPLFQNQEIDGVIILSHITNEYIEKVIATGLPTVLIDHHYPGLKADAILTNNRYSAYEAVNYLIELGHQSIAFVGNINFSPSYYERLEGYKLAHYKNGLPINNDYIYSHTEETAESIQAIMEHVSNRPTAWFCVNDGLGFLVNSSLQRQGVHVPEEASVCSFDNGQLSNVSTPKLTTVDIDLEYYGRKAVEQIIWRAEHPEAHYQEILLPAELIKRESTTKTAPYSVRKA